MSLNARAQIRSSQLTRNVLTGEQTFQKLLFPQTHLREPLVISTFSFCCC